jgi:hypothetical protein
LRDLRRANIGPVPCPSASQTRLHSVTSDLSPGTFRASERVLRQGAFARADRPEPPGCPSNRVGTSETAKQIGIDLGPTDPESGEPALRTCLQLAEILPWIQLTYPKSLLFPKPVSAAFCAISSSPNATTRSQGFIFIVLIVFVIFRLVLGSYAAGFPF